MLVLKGEGAGGTGKNTLSTDGAIGFSDRSISEGGHYPPEAAVGKAEGAYTQTLTTYPDAPATEHAFIRVVNKFGTAGINR